MLSAAPVINEILARNDGVIQDEDGDFSDFIELYNQGDDAVNLSGWYLTDDNDDLTRWQFPSVNLQAGHYLVVFASDKDRAIAGSELHTNFAISGEGEILALVRPDGITIESAFAEGFPPQYEDVSYGIADDVEVEFLIEQSDAADVLVPASGGLGTSWTTPAFVTDSKWRTGPLAVGFHTVEEPVPSTTVLQVDFNDRDASTNTQPGFDVFVMAGNGIQSSSVTRSFGNIDVTLSDAAGGGYDDRVRSDPTDTAAFNESRLLQDFVFSREDNSTGGIDVEIEGLTPTATYTLTVWSFDTGSAGSRVADWTANGIVAAADYAFDGAAVPPSPASNDLYRFGVVVSADRQGQITLQGRRDDASNTFGVFLNALKVETGNRLDQPADLADVLRVDFNIRTGGESGPANSEPGYSVMTLDDNGSVFNGVRVTLSGYNGANLGDRDRTTPIANGDFTLDQIYDDLVFSAGSAGSGMELLIQGLTPNVEYELVLRSLDPNAGGNRQARWTEESSGQSITIADPYIFNGDVAPSSNDHNTMRAQLVSSPQGTLLLRGVQLQGNRSVVVNAIELTRAHFDELIETDLESDMLGQNGSAYVRVPFEVTDLASIDQLYLDMQYDAGFVAYLNGQEIARRHAPTAVGVPPAFDADATMERSTSETLTPEAINLTSFRYLLNESSSNVLAIHGLNSAADDTDFLIAPQLRTVHVEGQALRYFQTPTPGAVNTGGVIDFVSEVIPSAGHGFYDAPFELELTTATGGAEIYYTLNGSVPSADNPTALLYQGPFFIDTTTVLRSGAIHDGFGDSPIGTETYIFLEDVLVQDPLNDPQGLTYPSIWQANATADFEMDPEVVAQWDDNDPGNADFGIREALLSLPTMSIAMDHEDLWNSSTGIYPNATSAGSAWRRPGSIEYFNPNTGEQFQYNVGVQMHGSASRDNVRLKKHSFRLVFNSEFDGPGTLEFPLFDNSDFADINTVVMRASFTDSFATRTQTGRYSPLDSTYTRDVFMRDTQLAMGSFSPDSTYVHLYINGLYWGLYSPAERTDDAFLASHIGGEREDWDIIRDFNELYRGTKDVWNEMFSVARQMSGVNDTTADAIYQQLQGRNPDGTLNPASTAYLDMENFIDYMILHLYAGVEDWPSHNWVAARNRADPGLGFQFFTWDQEIAFDGRFRDRTEADNSFTPSELLIDLRNSPEFRLRFADRVQKHMFNAGALTTQANQERWQWRADQVEMAIIAESARWGDAREGEVIDVPPTIAVPTMTVDHWRASIAEVRDEYFPQHHSLAISRFQNDGLFPTIAPAEFSQHGGSVLAGYLLDIDSPSGGLLYVTVNGQDPRLAGGQPNPSATLFSQPLQINQTTTVKARALVGGQWSALTEATYSVTLSGGGVVISEINYHPHAPSAAELAQVPNAVEDDFEFIEVLNSHPTDSLNLLGMSLANGLSFTFGNVLLAPGEYAVVVEDTAAFEARYGSGRNVVGQWSGGVSNSGETIELRDALGEILVSISYSDGSPWSEAPDGDGATLELAAPYETPTAELGKLHRWRASTEFGGTPGAAGTGPIGVVINEVLTHTNQPETDAIELYNSSDHDINIGGWYLSDSGGNPLKFQIPLNTVLQSGQYIVFDEEDFNPVSPGPGQEGFALDGSEGDDVFLVIPDGAGGIASLVDSVHFGAAFDGQTFGRAPDAMGRLAPMSRNTLGATNSTPSIGPLVITEINYNPAPPSAAALLVDASLVASDLEFIEIINPTNDSIDLTDTGIAGDSSFDFAVGQFLAAKTAIVLVSFDPVAPGNASRAEAFRTHYGIGPEVLLAGPFFSELGDVGARLELQIPDMSPPNTPSLIPKVLGDEVLYDNVDPWPTSVSGNGNALQRKVPTAFGNDGNSWQAAPASPGTIDFSGALAGDFNGDGQHTLLDLESLTDAIQSGSPIAYYDLNSDGNLDSADVSFLVDNIVMPIAGDYNWDMNVDQADYDVWKSAYRSTFYLNADGNGDGSVNAADYTIWRNNQGASGTAAREVGLAADDDNESSPLVVTVVDSVAEEIAATTHPTAAVELAIESLYDDDPQRETRRLNRLLVWKDHEEMIGILERRRVVPFEETKHCHGETCEMRGAHTFSATTSTQEVRPKWHYRRVSKPVLC